jgi:hypothetical protein
MPASKDAQTLAEASRIRDDDERRKAVRELSKERKKVSETEGGVIALTKPDLRKQWRDETIEGTTDLQWDEWLTKRKNED